MHTAQRQRILNAASQEIISSGYAASSLSAIAARIGLTKGALARKFPTKDTLAWAIIETLTNAIDEEIRRSVEVYPDSGVRALTRFLLALGFRSQTDPRITAAIVLFTDRSSLTHKVAEVMDTWIHALLDLCNLAEDQGEFDGRVSAQELAEYLFVATLGEGLFGMRAYASESSPKRMRFFRFTLKAAGAPDCDATLDEVIESNANGTLSMIPARRGISRPVITDFTEHAPGPTPVSTSQDATDPML